MTNEKKDVKEIEEVVEEVKPTVGRMVLFTNNEGVEFPANVVNVNDEGAIDLNVFTLDGVKVERIVEEGDENMQWHWMKFQKDQQKRNDKPLTKEDVEAIVSEILEGMSTDSEVEILEKKDVETLIDSALKTLIEEGKVEKTEDGKFKIKEKIEKTASEEESMKQAEKEAKREAKE